METDALNICNSNPFLALISRLQWNCSSTFKFKKLGDIFLSDPVSLDRAQG
jgi:hypothetical protein